MYEGDFEFTKSLRAESVVKTWAIHSDFGDAIWRDLIADILEREPERNWIPFRCGTDRWHGSRMLRWTGIDPQRYGVHAVALGRQRV